MYTLNSTTANAVCELTSAPPKESIRAQLDELNDLSEKILNRLYAVNDHLFGSETCKQEDEVCKNPIFTVEGKMNYLRGTLLTIDALSETISKYLS